MVNGLRVLDTMRNNKRYDGNTDKFGIDLNNQSYIIKLRKDHISSVYSEHIASRFIRNIGIRCHETWLGLYGKELVVIMKDFTDINCKLRSYKDTKQSSEDTDLSTKQYTYKDVLYLINQHTKMSNKYKEYSIKQFWQMFICDAILGNRDRHHGNWGYLTYEQGYVPAPIYDNGSSLFPDVEVKIAEYEYLCRCGNEFKFIEERAETFPASLFRIEKEDGSTRRTNYNEILGDLRVNKVLASQVKEIKEKVGFEGVFNAICKATEDVKDIVPYWYRRFYIVITCTRYLHLVERKSIRASYDITVRRLSYNG